LFSSHTPTAIDYNPNISATMQQPSSVVHANYKTYKTTLEYIKKTQKKHKCSVQSFGGKTIK